MDAASKNEIINEKCIGQPQCQFFVVRKKRLCRMTVRPGREYCGEHEPQPRTEKGKDDTRIPCPYDPKHTCYASKLLKHLAICNARQLDTPSYIVNNVNAPLIDNPVPRTQLSLIPLEKISALINKVNILYDKHVKGTITTMPDQPIHEVVNPDFMEEGRAESSLRHLRQASSLLHVLEDEGLVQDGTCYVELGAGKGHLSYYAYKAWCQDNSSNVVLVDRASLRHKRDNKLREPRADGGGSCRIRADLAHLALDRVPEVAQCDAVVGLAKHLCGAATDYALRCITGAGVVERVRGVVLATCCHHRCEPAAYVAGDHLQEMGITAEDFNIMLGVVSWATCGDGRSRPHRAPPPSPPAPLSPTDNKRFKWDDAAAGLMSTTVARVGGGAGREERAEAGRRAKALLDHARVLQLRRRGLRARLVHYVPAAVSLENVAIVASRA